MARDRTEYQREYQRQWIAARRAEFFDGKCCVKCGSADRLELDHIDPAQKVSHRVWSWRKSRRDAEIAKCQVLCTSCHLEKTLSQMERSEHGNPSRYRKGCRCDACREGQRIRIANYRAAKRAA